MRRRLQCNRCGHKWVPRKEGVRICPTCGAQAWDVQEVYNRGFKRQSDRAILVQLRSLEATIEALTDAVKRLSRKVPDSSPISIDADDDGRNHLIYKPDPDYSGTFKE